MSPVQRTLRDATRNVTDAQQAYANGNDLSTLCLLAAARADVDQAITQTVDELRHGACVTSWTAIGRLLGTSRQNAQQRYGPRP